jgi:Fur family ferric uptake transcriptional regulator
VTDLHGVVAERLAVLAQRYTTGRQRIVGLLESADRPLSIPDLLKADDHLVQSSLYRNLTVLEQAGVVHRVVTTGDFARYELAEDLTAHHHHHLICSRCGVVDDIVVPDALERSVEDFLRRVSRKQGFQPSSHRLDVIGLCATCVA